VKYRRVGAMKLHRKGSDGKIFAGRRLFSTEVTNEQSTNRSREGNGNPPSSHHPLILRGGLKNPVRWYVKRK
jgi:hypothetical protein